MYIFYINLYIYIFIFILNIEIFIYNYYILYASHQVRSWRGKMDKEDMEPADMKTGKLHKMYGLYGNFHPNSSTQKLKKKYTNRKEGR